MNQHSDVRATSLAEMSKNDKDLIFRTPQARRSAERTRSDKPNEVFPGIFSNDRAYLEFLDRLSRRLTSAFPSTVDDDGWLHGNGVRSNFYNVRYVGGFPMEPATWPLLTNDYRRDQESLANTFQSSFDERLFRSLVRVIFKDWDKYTDDIFLRKGSSSMVPFFTTDPQLKKAIVEHSLRSYREARDMWAESPKKAFARTGIGGPFFLVYRSQNSDKITFDGTEFTPKARFVAPQEYALSNGRAGDLIEADRNLEAELRHNIDGFFRPRLRTAMGAPLGLSSTQLPVAQAVRRSMYARYAFTYHHTTRAQKEEKVRRFEDGIFLDVSDHDMLWPSTLYLPVLRSELAKMFDDGWLQFFDAIFRTPIYVSAPSRASGQTLLGTLTDYSNSPGLNSGNPWTDLVGSIGMTYVYRLIELEHVSTEDLRLLRDATDVELDRSWDIWLKGEADSALLDKSDDAVLLFRDLSPEKRRRIADLREKMKRNEQVSSYMKVSYEHGAAFLGDVCLTSGRGFSSDLQFIGNINSYVSNLFSPEYSLDSHIKDRSRTRRGYPGFGYISHREVYGGSPIWRELNDIIDKEWFKSYGETFDSMRRRQYHADTVLLRENLRRSATPDLSPIDLEVLASLDKLSYKFSPADVSPFIRDLHDFYVRLDDIGDFLTDIQRRKTL